MATRGKASRSRSAAAAEAADPAPSAAPVVLPPEALQYLEYVRVQKRLAARTLTLYTLDLEKLVQFAAGANRPLLELQNAHIRGFVARMHGAGRSGRGIALILSGWRGFFAWAARQGLVPNNPVQDVRAPRAPKPLPKALGVDDAVRLAEHEQPGADPWLEARDAAVVELLYGCGLRVGELVGLDVIATSAAHAQGRGWLDLQAGEAHVFGKGAKRRSVPMGAAAMQAVRFWLEVRAQPFGGASARLDSALFVGRRGARLTSQSVWLRLRERSQLAGLTTPVHPHMLRHSFASHLLQSSGNLRAVQELLGHANITTTQVYTRLDFQHLAQVYDAAHPRARRKSED